MAQLQSTSITGSLIVTQGITGSFSGSISNATSASYAATASYALNAGDSVWTGSAGNIYYNGGNVGIGTASPTSKLTIYDTTQNTTTYSASLSVQNFGGVDDNNRIQIAGLFHSSVSPSANVYGFGVQGIGEKPGSYGHGVVGVQGVGKISGVNNSTGTLYAIGVEGLVYATGSNSTYYRANTTYGLRSTLIATPGSTIATHYGLYVAEGNRQGGSVITSSYAIVTEAGAGNVGIGTTAPSQKFVVSNGSSEVFKVYSTGEVVVGTNYIYAAYSSGTSFYSQGPASFRDGIHNDTSTYLKIDGGTSGFTYFSGNVGIGTTNPAAKLYVVGSSQNTLALDSPAYPELTFRVSGTVKSYDAIVTTNQGYFNTSTVGDRIYRTEAGNHLFGYSTTEIMRIASGGNVGIGTANPTEKLHVIGNTIIQATSTGNGTTAVRVNNSAGTQVLAIGAAGEIIMNNSSKISTIVDPTSTQPQLELYNAGTGYTTLQSSTSYGLLLNPNGSNVGIGTTNPAYKLDVFGIDDTTPEIRIGNSSGKTAFIGFSSTYGFDVDAGGVGGNYLNLKGGANGSTGGITFSTFALERMRIDYTGNVGIGTTTPSQKLVVNGRAIVGGGLTGDALSISTSIGTYTFNGYDLLTPSSFLITAGSSGYLSLDGYPVIFKVSGGERMRVNTDGNIGIGTTSPTYKLDVVGIIRSNSSNVGTVNLGTDSFSSSNTTSQVIGQTSPSYTSTGKLSFKVLTWGVGSDYGPTEQMYIDVTGPDTKAATLVMLPYGGNVGIGVTSPESKLHIAQSNAGGKVTLYIDNNASSTLNNEATIKFSVDSGASATNGGAEISTINVNANNGNSDLTFKTFNASSGFTEKVRFTTNGNVGVGTTSPSDKLSVVGNVSVTSGDYRIYNGSTILSSTSTSLLEINAGGFSNVSITNGNVGIGTTSPVFKLDVNGNTRIGGNSGSNTARLNVGGVANEWVADFQASSTTNQSYGLVVRAGTSSTDFPFYVLNSSSANAFFAIKGNGNIGIGTTSPIAKLNIASDGNTQFTLTRTNASNSQQFNINVESDSQASISYDSNSPLVIGTSTNPGTQAGFTERMRITSAGNVGIGTTSPTAFLDVKGLADNAGTISLQLRSGNSATNFNSNQITLGYSNSDTYRHAIKSRHQSGAPSGNAIDFYTWQYGGSSSVIGGQHVMSLDGANVGIGTTSPSTKLHLYEAGASDVIFRITPADGSYDPLIQLTGQGNSISSEGFEVWYANSVGDVHLSTTYPNSAAAIRFHTATGASKSTSNERMTITGDGNVGIGTASPSEKLHVAGRITATTSGYTVNPAGAVFGLYTSGIAPTSYIQAPANGNVEIWNDGTGAIATFSDSGNVGIGTNSPAFPLHVARSSGDSVIVADSGTSSNSQFRFQEAGSLTAAITFVSSDDSLRFYNGGDRFTILSSGNIGIGTTSPAALLHVSQPSANTVFRLGNNTTYDQFIYFNGSNDWSMGMDYSNSNAFVLSNYSSLGTNDRLVVTTGGNVGIGTTSPAAKLDVVGSAGIRVNEDGIGTKVISIRSDFAGVDPAINVSTNNALLLQTNNTERMRIAAGGNVGIGTTSPNALLHVAGTIHSFPSTTDGILQASQAGSSGGLTTVVIRSNGVSYFNGGNVGIGVTAPAAKLQVSGSTNVLNVRGSGSAVTSSIFSVDGNNGRLFEVSDDLSNSLFSVNTIAGLPVIEAFADYTVTMGTYGAYSLQVTGSRVGVGTPSPGYPLHVSGSVSGISIYATNDIAAFSDQSVKTDLQVIDSAVDRIKQINGYTYVRVDDLSNTRRAGVIAQEVQKVLPEVVSENSDGTLNVAYSNMIALLIEGMKEQQVQIDKLREDLEDLRYEL